MRVVIAQRCLELRQGDVTDQEVDALVNAANSALAGGGGVDGAIHRRGGPAIMAETRRRYPDGCPTGEAVVSGAGQLPARHVIHAVGPFWSGGGRGEAELLAGAYRRSLALAAECGCGSVALPALSTGAYRYPIREAARVALAEALAWLRTNERPELVRFVLFDRASYETFAAVLSELTGAALSAD